MSDELHHQSPPSLPDELIFEILLRFPIKFLLQLKCICKSWRTIISHPLFASSHIRRLTGNPSIYHHRLFSSHLFKYHTEIASFSMKSLLENPSKPIEPVEFNMEHQLRILGSCNGLLCLYDTDQGYVKLWNPCIRFESKKSPKLDCFQTHNRPMIIYYGFGYDHVNDKYKVLLSVRHASPGRFYEYVTQIYTFGENCWTTIQNFPFSTIRPVGIFVSGTLNWVKPRYGSNRSVIISFDIEKETYKEVLLPENDGVEAYNHVLGVFNNCLSVCFNSIETTNWNVWVMGKYGNAESWTRLMMIPKSCRFPILLFDILFILENGIGMTTSFLRKLNNGSEDLEYYLNELGQDQHIYHESLVAPQC